MKPVGMWGEQLGRSKLQRSVQNHLTQHGGDGAFRPQIKPRYFPPTPLALGQSCVLWAYGPQSGCLYQS